MIQNILLKSVNWFKDYQRGDGNVSAPTSFSNQIFHLFLQESAHSYKIDQGHRNANSTCIDSFESAWCSSTTNWETVCQMTTEDGHIGCLPCALYYCEIVDEGLSLTNNSIVFIWSVVFTFCRPQNGTFSLDSMAINRNFWQNDFSTTFSISRLIRIHNLQRPYHCWAMKDDSWWPKRNT